MISIKKILTGTLFFSFALTSMAETTIGLGVGYGQKPYRGDSSEWLPIPNIEHTSGRFFISGLKTGVNLWDTDTTKFNVNVSYLPLRFKPSDSEGALKQLDKRKSTLLGGFGLSQQFGNTGIKAGLSADVLGNSDSVLIDVSVNHRLKPTEKLTVVPNAGLLWANEDHNNYYFGVSARESNRSGVKRYSADNSISPYVGLMANYKLTKQFSIFGFSRVDILPSEVKDSPMVDRSATMSFAIGGNYSF